MSRREQEHERERQHERWLVHVAAWPHCPLEPITRGLPPRLRGAIQTVWSAWPLKIRTSAIQAWVDQRLRLIIRVEQSLQDDGRALNGCFRAGGEGEPDLIEIDKECADSLPDDHLRHLVGHELGHWIASVTGQDPEPTELREALADDLAALAGCPRPAEPFDWATVVTLQDLLEEAQD